MSTLTELVDIAEETKENSKNALIEKGLELDESFKLSDVDEKIAEIESGTGGVDISTLGLQDYAIVIAEGIINKNDTSAEVDLYLSKYGDSLQSSFSSSMFLTRYNDMHNIYITMIHTMYKKIILAEESTYSEFGNEEGTTGEIDISGGGIILAKMYER